GLGVDQLLLGFDLFISSANGFFIRIFHLLVDLGEEGVGFPLGFFEAGERFHLGGIEGFGELGLFDVDDGALHEAGGFGECGGDVSASLGQFFGVFGDVAGVLFGGDLEVAQRADIGLGGHLVAHALGLGEQIVGDQFG